MKKRTIHKVRNPFMCRVGQFTPDKSELCIGLDYQTLTRTTKFECYLGKNDRIVYEINPEQALKIGHQWRNPKGKLVLIIPLKIAKVKDNLEEESFNSFNGMAQMANSPEWEKLRRILHK